MKQKDKDHKIIHRDLIEQCKKGNREAQFEIYRLYYRAMYNTCFRILNRREEAEDIMQEAFLKAFRNIATYREEVNFGAWLRKIVINQSLDELRKRKSYFESIEDIEEHGIEAEDTEDLSDSVERIEEIRKVINNLPEGYRLVLNLYLFEGYDHDEIAQILGISASTSRSQLARARKKLTENLKKGNDG